ncbi:MAG: hypothetical protein AAF525_00235 [Pseudomonadota bacterium]
MSESIEASDVVSLNAGGSVLDAGDARTDITATSLRVVTGGGFGIALNALETDVDNLSATVGGGLNLIETDGLTITSIASTVERTLPDATTVSVEDAAQSDVQVTGDGHLLMTVLAGTLTVEDGNVDGAGLLLAGTGHLRIDAALDVVVQASVMVTDGAVTIVAGDNVTLEGTADLTAGTGTVRIAAASGSISMAEDLVVLTDAANIRFTAAGDVTLGLLDARSDVDRAADALTGQGTWGDISLEAGATISDSSPADGDVDVYANALRMSAGLSIGALSPAFANAIETEVVSVTAITGGALDNDFINIVDASGLAIATVADVVVSEVAADGTTSDLLIGISQSDVMTTAQGGVVLRALDGDLVITDGDADSLGVVAGGLGNVLLDATGDIVLGADVTSEGGDIRIEADGAIDQATDVNVLTTDATIDVEAFGGDITMADGAFASTGAGVGNIRYHATGSVTVGGLDAGSANVSVFADTGSIFDAGDATMDVAGFAFAAYAAITIGTAVDPLETDVGVLAAESSDGIFIVEATGLVLDRVTALVDRVLPDGTTLPISDVSVVDVVTTGGGDILLRTTDGRIVLNDGDTNGVALSAAGTGNIRLQAVGETRDIIVNADILADTGIVSLSAQNDVIFGADADLRTGGSVIDIEAIEGSILLADEALIVSGGENIRAAALVDVLLGGIDAGTGDVSILTGLGSVLDAGDTYVDVTAEGYRVTAGNTVGGIGGTNPDEIDTSVSTLSVEAVSGIGIVDSDDITVDGVAVTVQRLSVDGTTSDIVDASQSDIVTGDNGSIVLRSSAGTITINDGDDADGNGVDADGSGDITLDGVDVVLNATVTTDSGDISVTAGSDIDQNTGGDLTTGGGDISLAAGGDITSDDTTTSSGGGDVDIAAGEGLVLAEIDAGAGDIALSSGEDLVLENNLIVGGNLVAQSDGDLTVNDSDGDGIGIDATGNVLLTGEVITIDADVQSSEGHITLEGETVVQNDDLHTDGGTIDVLANDTIVMADGALTESNDGDVRYRAGNNVVLAGIDTGAGNVAVISTEGSILDGGDTHDDVAASGLLLSAADNIGVLGTDADAIDVAVDTLTASTTAGDIHLMETDDVTIGSVSVIVEHVAEDGSTSTEMETGSDLVAGDDVVLVVDGQLTVVDGDDNALGIESGDDLLLVADSLTLTTTVRSNANLSIETTGDVLQSPEGHIETVGGSIDVISGADLLMADGAQAVSNGGDIRYQAENDIVLGGLYAGTGDVAVISTAGRIIDGGDSHVDVTGSGVVLQAADDIGVTLPEAGGVGSLNVDVDALTAMTNPLEINADTLAAASTGGDINIVETDDVVIGPVTVEVERVDAATGDTMTIITTLNNVATSGEGTVQIVADGGLSMTDEAMVVTEDGSIAITTMGAIELLTLMSDTGDIMLVTVAGIVDVSVDESANIVTQGLLTIDAETGIGSASNDLDTDVGQITAINRTSGDIVLQESDALTIAESGIVNEGGGDVTISVGGELMIDGMLMTVEEGAVDVSAAQGLTLNNTITTEAGDISLTASFGDIVMTDGMSLITTQAGDIALTATGDVLLTQASTTMGNIAVESVNGSILDNSTSEDANLIAGGMLTLNAAVSIGSGEVDGSLNLNAGTVNLLGFMAENIAVKFEDGPEFIGSLEGLYAIVTKRDFEPWTALTEPDTTTWPRLDEVIISPYNDLLQLVAERELMPPPFYTAPACTILAQSSEELLLSMHLLVGDGQTLSDTFNDAVSLALLDVELGLRFL